MSITAKRILFAIGLLIIWLGFVFGAGSFASLVIAVVGGWTVGGWIYTLSTKVFPD
jgi:hypothetical protein